MKSHLLNFALINFAFGVKIQKNNCQLQYQRAYPHVFFLGVLQLQALHSSFNLLWVGFVYDVR